MTNELKTNPITLKYLSRYLSFELGQLNVSNHITKEEFLGYQDKYEVSSKKIKKYITMLENVRNVPERFDPKDIAGVDVSNELNRLEEIIEELKNDWQKINNNQRIDDYGYLSDN